MKKNFTAEDKYKEKQNTVLVVCKSLLTLVYTFKEKMVRITITTEIC